MEMDSSTFKVSIAFFCKGLAGTHACMCKNIIRTCPGCNTFFTLMCGQSVYEYVRPICTKLINYYDIVFSCCLISQALSNYNSCCC